MRWSVQLRRPSSVDLLTFLAAASLCLLLVATDTTATEPADICATCQCSSPPPPDNLHVVLNCTHRELRQLVATYPPANDTDGHPTATPPQHLHLLFSSNPLHELHALPVTEAAQLSFHCRRCRLTFIATAAFAAIPHLRRLDLSDNELTGAQLTASAFHGSRISELVLAGNRIEQLANGVLAEVGGLRTIDLSRNRLTQLAALLAVLPLDVSWLDVSGNLLGKEPELRQLASVPRIRQLNLWNNSWTAVPETVGALNASLVRLELGGGTELANISAVRDLPALRELHVHGVEGALQLVGGDDLRGLPQLRHLRLVGNSQLATVNLTGLLDSAASLQVIDVRSNALRTLQLGNGSAENRDAQAEAAKTAFGSLQMLQMADNPWHCDCALYQSLVQLLPLELVVRTSGNETRFESEFNARCASPHSVVTDFLVDLLMETEESACAVRNVHKPQRWEAQYEPPAFLRPGQIVITVLAVTFVVLLGTGIGLAIVYVQRRLRASASAELRESPVRYTTVRNSTMMPRGASTQGTAGRASWRASLGQQQQQHMQLQQMAGEPVELREQIQQLRPAREPPAQPELGMSTFRSA